jgi:hypothetical protein
MQTGVKMIRSAESIGNLILASDVAASEGGIFGKDYKPPPRTTDPQGGFVTPMLFCSVLPYTVP